ncbi:MAG: phosphonoacetaldehyde reductase [Bacteroidales bacterium]|nr:phosphonoacetaldehyde reductase [Bacteroidales bacterium]
MQTIYYGIEHLCEAFSGDERILLVCGGSYRRLPVRDEIEKVIAGRYVIFDRFTPNPRHEEVLEGVELISAERCDTILAVGGGSAMDVAKCIKYDSKIPARIIAVPTTAGSGSESTRFAVIYYDGVKQSIVDDSLLPDVAVLEPKVLQTLPLYQKKCTMLDALCHAIESWWSVNSNERSRSLSREAVSLVMGNCRDYIFGNTAEAAEAIMKASNIAGQAICITQTTAAHAFSYKLTTLYGLPHGQAVAVCLPEIWQFMMSNMDRCVDPRGAEYLAATFSDIAGELGCSTAEEAVRKFRTLLELLDLHNPLSEDRERDLDITSTSVNPVRLRNNPVAIDERQARAIYEKIIGNV